MSYKDITINGVPSISNTVASGYFGKSSSTTLYNNSNWNSVGPCTLKNGGGIATSSGNALILTNIGIYRLNLSVDVTNVQNGGAQNTLSFAFGTSNISNVSSTSSFIGTTSYLGSPNGSMLANKGYYSTGNIQFISWITNAYSSGNNAISQYSSSGNPPWFNYYSRVNNNNLTYPGLCCTEVVFTSRNNNQALYFNVNTDKDNVTMGQCYFVLQMLSTQIPDSTD